MEAGEQSLELLRYTGLARGKASKKGGKAL